MARPVVASYCADFLKPDMQHIYRQISDLREWDARVITHRRENETLFPWAGKKLRVLPRRRWRNLRRIWYHQCRRRPVPPTTREIIEFLYQVKRFDARVVHIYFGHVAVRWLPMIRACPVPVVVSFHGADAAVGVSPASLRELFARVRLVLARSAALLHDLRTAGCPPEKLRLHRTGVPLDFWTPPAAGRERPADGAWHFVQACRFVEKKGLDLTLRAFSEVAGRFPAARLTLMGDGRLRPSLDRLARSLSIADRIAFPGFVAPEEVRKIYHSAHAFIHPSRTTADGNREGVPNSLLEAMATGLPVLATRHGGIPEAVEDGISGFLVNEDDYRALARATLTLIESGDLETMGTAARAAVMDGFERGVQTSRLERLYDEAAGWAASPAPRQASARPGIPPPPAAAGPLTNT